MLSKQILIHLLGSDIVLLEIKKTTGHFREQRLFKLDFPAQDGMLILLTQLLDSIIALLRISLRCKWCNVIVFFAIFQTQSGKFIFRLLLCQLVCISICK